MERILKIEVLLADKSDQYELPVDGNMALIDFYFALHRLLADMYPIAATFDFYTKDFERIAIVSNNEEIYINPKYQAIGCVIDLIDDDIDVIEAIPLSKTSAKKVLEEEALLETALNNYKE